MNFDPQIFGEGFHRFVQMETDLFLVPYGVLFHVITAVILFLVFRFGNKYRRIVILYFAINWLFLFGYWGIYAVYYWFKIGLPYLAAYFLAPVLLGIILYQWILEIFHPKIDLDFTGVKMVRFFVLLISIWGFWYPTYFYGRGFELNVKDLFLSNYGLMPCPTTMVVLSLLTLKYPSGNKTLFNLFTIYALLPGTATVLSGWLPDIPFILLGLYSLSLILYYKGWKDKVIK